jgi:hypothetical protein
MPDVDCTSVDERNALVRWWQDRAKPFMQYTHWGYPEYFEETPFGTSVRAHQRAQISSGWAARLVLYQYDFCDGGVTLNPSGQRRLKDLATGFDCWSHHRLLIEATPDRPQLAAARRNHVTKMLHDSGIPAHVEVGTPTGFMPTGDEALLMNMNLLRQVRSGGGTSACPRAAVEAEHSPRGTAKVRKADNRVSRGATGSGVVLECGGLTPLSFCVSFAFCTIAVGVAERKKGTAKAASSHRTPKKQNAGLQPCGEVAVAAET